MRDCGGLVMILGYGGKGVRKLLNVQSVLSKKKQSSVKESKMHKYMTEVTV
jgi:hypothetical protein